MEFTTSEWLPRSGVFVHFCAFLAFFLSYEGRGGRVRRSFFHFVSFTGHGCWWSFTPTTVDCTFYFWLDHFCLRHTFLVQIHSSKPGRRGGEKHTGNMGGVFSTAVKRVGALADCFGKAFTVWVWCSAGRFFCLVRFVSLSARQSVSLSFWLVCLVRVGSCCAKRARGRARWRGKGVTCGPRCLCPRKNKK